MYLCVLEGHGLKLSTTFVKLPLQCIAGRKSPKLFPQGRCDAPLICSLHSLVEGPAYLFFSFFFEYSRADCASVFHGSHSDIFERRESRQGLGNCWQPPYRCRADADSDRRHSIQHCDLRQRRQRALHILCAMADASSRADAECNYRQHFRYANHGGYLQFLNRRDRPEP